MATTEDRLIRRQLEAARHHLLARGDAEAVKSLDTIIERLAEPVPEAAPEVVHSTSEVKKDLLTEWEAADLLGIRSTGKVWQWVRQGKLAFQFENGHPRIIRASVEGLLGDPVIEEQRTFERELSEALAPFEGDPEDAHTWFARVSPRLRVIEDQPPHEIAWIEPHPDPNDAWLWNAARRNRADVVLTVNLRDGPPVGSDGLSHHDGTTFMHPGAFIVLLDVWNRVQATGTIPDDLETEIRDTVSPASSAQVPAVVAQVRVLLARMAEEAGPAPHGTAPAP